MTQSSRRDREESSRRSAPVVRRRPLPRTSTPTCSRSASWRTSSASGRTATSPTTTSTRTSTRPTSASIAASSARSAPTCASPKGYVMSDEQILDRGAEAGRQRLHRDAHRRRPAPSAAVRLVPQRHPHPARGVSRAAPQGLDGGRDRLVLPADQEAGPRDMLDEIDRRRPRQPARRRGGDLPSRGPRPDLRAQGRRRRAGSASTARPTSSACAPTPRCSTATSRSRSTASTT